MLTFNNDEDRKNFQLTMALQMLRQEVKYGHIVCDPRKGSTVKTLSVPIILVLTASNGKNSQEGTCFKAAA